MNIWIAVTIFVVAAVVLLILYSCIKAGSEADKRLKQMRKTGDDA